MKRTVKIFIACGAGCILLLLLSSWYAVTFQQGRLVSPMRFEDYSFRVQDLPMILSLLLLSLYVVALFVALFRAAVKSRRQSAAANVTRRLSPKLGLLGFLGFLGFAGFVTYPANGSVFPFVFFVFFGFFGFYYEGKMSQTLMDERFRENAARANLRASNIAFTLLFIALIAVGQGHLLSNPAYSLIALLIALSLVLALRLFLGEYLLYRYDHGKQDEE